MNFAPLGSYRHDDVGSIFGQAIQSATSTNRNYNATTGGQASDTTQLSPLAQILGTLQNVQQSNPSQYQQLTQLIATNLNQTANQSGNSDPANQLTQLASDFTNASTTGNLPNITDLSNVIGTAGDQGYSSGGSTAGQFQEDSLAVQISFSETSINNTAPATSTNNSSTVQSGASQQFQESSLAYQFSFTETSTTSGTETTQPSLLDAQQLIALIAKSLQTAASTAQSSGDSVDAKLLTQLATDFTNALNAEGSANTQSPNNSTSGSQPATQQLQESLQSYQLNFNESSTNGNTANQEAFSLSATNLSLSAVF